MIPEHCGVGSECFLVSLGSLQGLNKYGLYEVGDSTSRLCCNLIPVVSHPELLSEISSSSSSTIALVSSINIVGSPQDEDWDVCELQWVREGLRIDSETKQHLKYMPLDTSYTKN